jgi:hypothetical protein
MQESQKNYACSNWDFWIHRAMRRRILLTGLFVVGGLVLLFLGTTYVFPKREPVYNGKPMTYWIRQIYRLLGPCLH